MLSSAQRFLAGARLRWDRQALIDAARDGLSSDDAARLKAICQEEGEAYETAETEVVEACRVKAGLGVE